MEISLNIFDSINKIIFSFETTKEEYFLAKSIFEKYIYENWELNIKEDNNMENPTEKKFQNNFHATANQKDEKYSPIYESHYKMNPTKIPSYTENKNLNFSRDKLKEDINIQKFNKKIYRKIAVKSHPDKVHNKEKIFLFVKANYFYENNLTIGLIFYCKKN